MNENIDIDLNMSWWVNGLQQRVYVYSNALPEIMHYISSIETNEDFMNKDGVIEMISLFQKMNRLLYNNDEEVKDLDLEIYDYMFSDFMNEHLIEIRDKHLPIPVFSHIKPTTGKFCFLLRSIIFVVERTDDVRWF